MANNDFKHLVQDFNNFYIGARLTYKEMMTDEYMPFKWKAVIAHYFSKSVDVNTTMENHIFSLTEDDFAYQTYRELKAKFKLHVWVPADGKRKKTGHYESRVYKIEEIVKSKELHEKMDTIIVEELQLSKLSLLSFAV